MTNRHFNFHRNNYIADLIMYLQGEGFTDLELHKTLENYAREHRCIEYDVHDVMKALTNVVNGLSVAIFYNDALMALNMALKVYNKQCHTSFMELVKHTVIGSSEICPKAAFIRRPSDEWYDYSVFLENLHIDRGLSGELGSPSSLGSTGGTFTFTNNVSTTFDIGSYNRVFSTKPASYQIRAFYKLTVFKDGESYQKNIHLPMDRFQIFTGASELECIDKSKL